MTVTILIFSEEPNDVSKVKDAIELPLIQAFGKHNVKPSNVFKAKGYGNFCAKIAVSVPVPLGSIQLKEAKEDASAREG